MAAKPTSNTITAQVRTEFGKGAARRARRASLVPAVLYGQGTEPVHLALPSLEFAAIVRNSGTNAVLTITADGEEHLALTKQVVIHPLRNYIEHADLVVVRRGEKATVDVTVVLEGDAAPGSLVFQDANTLEVEADVMAIPEQLTVSVEGLEIGTQILAAEVELPSGVTLTSDPETLVVNVAAAPTEEDMEAEVDVEGAGVVEDEPESEEGTVADGEPDAPDVETAEAEDKS
ncbi:50S ribosomal protein L25/general stress protein Ctc [Rhodococcus aerolatus]